MYITKEQLLFDLRIAYLRAKRHKTNKEYVKRFAEHEMENLISIRDALWNREYYPGVSTCFVIQYPKKREIFAALFVDRIVHHLYYEYTHVLFENTFIHDTYSCIKGRGTSMGIDRLSHHIRSLTSNYTEKCYILKLDIKGYFIHIDREILLEKVLSTLKKLRFHSYKGRVWDDLIDFSLIYWLSEVIILLDPTTHCIIKGKKSDWNGLPDSKSLFKGRKGCGLPIGNLTSQLFSNVYLNTLDLFVKRELKCKHYGRYVDDFYFLSKEKGELLSYVPKVEALLNSSLKLELQKGKILLSTSLKGVEFLGSYLKPYRNYISHSALRRIKNRILNYEGEEEYLYHSLNSVLGTLSRYSTYKMRYSLLKGVKKAGILNNNYTKLWKYLSYGSK